ncbi:ferredoxin--NADP reductase [Zobellella maritima]|uniref:ferredoxin--NADP reductase n=1 Tax=Zobellella maritima TaxID=2059725 RepID=UPI000E303F97|nr:FAD-dependent oxidoreductase [Zobellella maritima]
MTTFTLKLKRKESIADGTLAFYFDRPAGFDFQAGQCARLGLIDPPETDEEGNGRIFSLAGAPYEQGLMVATRVRDSAFKRVLSAMAPGEELTLKGPYGSYTLHNKAETPAVFITGGIGVTPVRSMILQALHDEAGHRLTVFYANRRPEDAAFLDELTRACAEHANCTLIATMTQMDKSRRDWQGETGYIDQAMLRRYLDDLSRPVFYLDGPPAMVKAMRQMLNESGVDEDNIRTEEFAGY